MWQAPDELCRGYVQFSIADEINLQLLLQIIQITHANGCVLSSTPSHMDI